MEKTLSDVSPTRYMLKEAVQNLEKNAILVVDDMPDNLRLLSQILTIAGYRVRVATDGEQALESVQVNPPAIILLDIMMPGLDGYEVCLRLKAEPTTRNIPVIFISARGDVESKIKAFDVGGVDYVSKPFQPQEVLARVRTHIALRELQQNLQEQLVKHEKLIAELDSINLRLQSEIAERQRFERDLLESKEHFRTVADFTYNWEYWVDPDGRFIYMSPACYRMTGYRPEEFQKNPQLIFKIVHSEDRPAWIVHLNTMLGDVDVFATRLRITTREGEERWLGHTCQPVYNADGRFLGRRASNRDITEQVRAEQQLWRYAADLQAQNEELDAFAHTVAHDLKNPLATMVGYTYLLERRANDLSAHDRTAMAVAIGQNARKMAGIVDELLLLASVRKLEEVDIQPLDMGQIVAEALGRLETLIHESNASITQPAQWPIAQGHTPWVEEMWVNYIGNALKYGGRLDEAIPPRVVLGYDLPPQSGDGVLPAPSCNSAPSQIRFWVEDNGPGLTEQAQQQLFTQFTRLHQARIEGHGLGLSIVRRIAEKLGGQVGVESIPGEGSKFWFSLPEDVSGAGEA
ncbi:MAG TPA: response regulator [Anaerolineae bacterium]|nr:response regulator [Anaerolineae bacterium]